MSVWGRWKHYIVKESKRALLKSSQNKQQEMLFMINTQFSKWKIPAIDWFVITPICVINLTLGLISEEPTEGSTLQIIQGTSSFFETLLLMIGLAITILLK